MTDTRAHAREDAGASTIRRPLLELLTDGETDTIVEDALRVLERVGVRVESAEGRDVLLAAGAGETAAGRLTLPRGKVLHAVASAPHAIAVHDVRGDEAMALQEDRVHYDPGSAAVHLIEGTSRRAPVTRDLVAMIRVVERADCYAAQSTAITSSDVPPEVADRYRLYLSLRFGTKPVVTGTFRKDGFAPMREMLVAVRGSAADLAAKPLAVFDCCPSPPLTWSDLTCHALIECARASIPATIVAMPLAGATAPVTLRESVVQHCAEALSGILLHQSVRAGAPVLFGGAPAAFDMRRGSAPMGSMETMMIAVAYAQVGRRLGLPTHGYLAVSDAKTSDYQAGLESGVGAVLGALAGINLVSGAGMLDYLLSQSIEKILLDGEAIRMARRLVAGIAKRPADPAQLMEDVVATGSALALAHTRRHHRAEIGAPSNLIDRASHGDWVAQGRQTAEDRAREEARRIVAGTSEAGVGENVTRALDSIMQAELDRSGAGLDLRTLLAG